MRKGPCFQEGSYWFWKSRAPSAYRLLKYPAFLPSMAVTFPNPLTSLGPQKVQISSEYLHLRGRLPLDSSQGAETKALTFVQNATLRVSLATCFFRLAMPFSCIVTPMPWRSDRGQSKQQLCPGSESSEVALRLA